MNQLQAVKTLQPQRKKDVILGAEMAIKASKYLIYFLFGTGEHSLNAWKPVHFKFNKGFKWQGLRSLPVILC